MEYDFGKISGEDAYTYETEIISHGVPNDLIATFIQEVRERKCLSRFAVFTILDLGAGSGRFTRLIYEGLKDDNVNIIACEPSENLRKEFRKHLPAVTNLEGKGENIPLNDNGVDIVVICDAFHYMSDQQTVREIHRVLVEGGLFVDICDLFNPEIDFMKPLNEVVRAGQITTEDKRESHFQDMTINSELFGSHRKSYFNHSVKATAENCLDSVFLRNCRYLLASDTEKQAIREKAEALVPLLERDKDGNVTLQSRFLMQWVTRFGE